MIIIKTDSISDDINIIASIMFNIEVGKNVYGINGKFYKPDEDFNTISKNGITYSITYNNNIILTTDKKDFPKQLIDQNIQKLEVKYSKKYNTKTKKERIIDTYIFDNNFDNLYTWEIKDDFYTLFNSKTSKELIMLHNMLIIDTHDIFNTTSKVTMINDLSKAHFKMMKRFVNIEPILFNTYTNNIDLELRKLYNIHRKYWDFKTRPYKYPIFLPIYEEKLCNINPIGVNEFEYDKKFYKECLDPISFHQKIYDIILNISQGHKKKIIL